MCPIQAVPGLISVAGVRAAFIARCQGIDVDGERDEVLTRLWSAHREAADRAGFAGMPFVLAEQVHGAKVAVVERPDPSPAQGADGLATSVRGLCLAIYVADCAAVFLADRSGKAIALVHSGKKGTEAAIASRAVDVLTQNFACSPRDLIASLSPCIRPPHYEIDFAAAIRRQLADCGVGEIHDPGTCTASTPHLYYSYRREMGRTGRMLAVLALVN